MTAIVLNVLTRCALSAGADPAAAAAPYCKIGKKRVVGRPSEAANRRAES